MDVHEPDSTGSFLGSQLADAMASFLHTSFDDIAKNLVERLQTPEIESRPGLKIEEVGPSLEIKPGRLFNVPQRNLKFVGRSAPLSQLFGMWKPGQKGRIAVIGLGGIGKTSLVVEFVYRIRDVSPTTQIYWFRLDDFPSTHKNALSAASTQLDEWLKESRGTSCMLVVDPGDNFEGLLQTSAESGRLLDKIRLFGGSVIVLARSVQHGCLLASPREICELGDLDVEASVGLLSAKLETQAEGSLAELHDVVRLLAYLPRAIIQIAALIDATGMTIPQFLKLYPKDDSAKLRLFGRLDHIPKPHHTFSIIGKGVIDVKAFRTEFPAAAQILYKAYFLGGISVPGCILSQQSDPLEMIITMNHLKGHFLMDEDPADTYTVHPLVQLAIRKLLEGERPQADEENIKQERKWYEEVVVTFSKFYPDLNSDDREWWRSCFAHLLAEHSVQTDPLKLSVSKMHRRESSYLKRKGRYSEALLKVILAKNVRPNLLHSEHLGIIQDHISLLELLGQYREIQALLQTYPLDEQPSTILWKRRMQARLEQAEGSNRYDSALDAFRHLKISRETTITSMPDLLRSIDDLGYVLMLKGNYRDAENECRKALAGRTTVLGNSHPDTLASLHHLASILKLDGKFEEGLVHVQTAINGREDVLGVDHPETLQSKILKAKILALTAVSLSDFDEAETLLVDSSDRSSKILSDSHPLVIACRSDHAQIMLSRGKYDAAEQMNRTALDNREQGPWTAAASHPETLQSVHQLAELLRYKEGSRAADALSERAWTDRTDVLTHGTFTGSDFHPHQLSSLHHRALILSGLGLHLPALQKIDTALFGRKTILRCDHPDVFLSLTWKGEIMRSQLPTYQTQRDQTLDAIEGLHKQALEGLTYIFGLEHHNTLQCVTNLALAKHERGASGRIEAEALHRQVYRAYQRNLGDLHPETCKSKSRLAEAMRALSPHLHLEAKRMWREACGELAQMFGVDSYLTVTAYKEYEKFLKTYTEP